MIEANYSRKRDIFKAAFTLQGIMPSRAKLGPPISGKIKTLESKLSGNYQGTNSQSYF